MKLCIEKKKLKIVLKAMEPSKIVIRQAMLEITD